MRVLLPGSRALSLPGLWQKFHLFERKEGGVFVVVVFICFFHFSHSAFNRVLLKVPLLTNRHFFQRKIQVVEKFPVSWRFLVPRMI